MKLSDVAHGRDNNFNIIRILAALAVLVAHSFALTGRSTEPLQTELGMSLGTIAVDIFFITSGFLVSASLLTRRSTLEYLCARGLRIYPALLVMVGVTVCCVGAYFTTAPMQSYFTSPETCRYILKDSTLIGGVWYFLPGVFEHNPYGGSLNGSLWSMVHEVRLYLILAIFWVASRIAPKNRPRLFKSAIILCAMFFGAWHIIGHFHVSSESAFRHFSFRHLAFMFFSGATFYILKERVRLSWLVFWVFALMLAVSTVNQNLFFVIYNLVLAYTLLFLAYIPGGVVRAYNRLGDYSYGLYIYAFPVQQSVAALFPGISPWRMILISAPITLTLAALSWHLVEKKALGLKSSLLDHTRRIAGLRPAAPAIRPAVR
jgi:peptidoglycan/LPS O-acetylase OafA/YrhL